MPAPARARCAGLARPVGMSVGMDGRSGGWDGSTLAAVSCPGATASASAQRGEERRAVLDEVGDVGYLVESAGGLPHSDAEGIAPLGLGLEGVEQTADLEHGRVQQAAAV